MKPHLAFVGAILLAAMLTAHGQGADEKYIRIYNLIQEADGLNDSGQLRQAVAKYTEAQTALKEFQGLHPGWNDKVVNFRLSYIAARLEPLAPKAPVTSQPTALVATGTSTMFATNQLGALQEEIARLTAQNALLQAKLQEALSVQPTALDPRELAKAEEKIKQLQKERDLLKVGLEQKQPESRKPGESSAAEQERKILAEVKQKLAQQTELTASLQKENESLKQQMATPQGTAAPAGELNRELQLAKATIASLQATNVALRTDQIILERRLAQLSQNVAPRSALKQAEQERDDLKKKLNAANKQLSKSSNRSAPASADEKDRQLEAALARLEVYEAKQVPYTTEELALFKQPDLKVAVSDTNATPKKKARELPPGTSPLMDEAQRAIESGRFGEAEKKYLEVLRQDEKNVFVLGNLAAVQMEQNRLADAEKTIKQALAVDPQDAACFYLMGRLKFAQEKYDEALDALSLAARLTPDDPRTQYFLGKALIQKGNRSAAETALRKAVQLRPGWGEAHYSLAIAYATQQPAFKELAQWHYQKALAGGYPRNLEFEKLLEERKTAAAAK